jgi:aspartyl/asparaginyl beta-hydroxylase (cupin superfamily)
MRQPFYPIGDFPALHGLSRHWEVIRAEYRRLTAPEHDLARVGRNRHEIHAEVVRRGLGSGWLQGWTHDGQPNPRWLSYALMLFDRPPLDVRERMPRTVELLEGVGGVKAAALNKLLPHTLISAHQHPELRAEGLLQYHLCLTTSEPPCFTYLNVNGEWVQHLPGQACIFDGSLPHLALNATREERVILYVEFHADQRRATR